MRSPKSSSTTFKREFLKKWLLALRLCNNNKNKSHNTNDVVERQNTIKLSAEIAMASARNGATCWSRALITKHSSFHHHHHQIPPPPPRHHHHHRNKKSTVRMTCKKILKRSHRRRCSRTAAAAASMVRRKTEVLKKLVPGGEFIDDDVSLIRETLDYMVSLRAQVDVMRSLARASEESRRHHIASYRDINEGK